jgi:magnesium transporter
MSVHTPTPYNRNYYLALINSKNIVESFKKIPIDTQGFVLLELPKILQHKILRKIKNKEINHFLKFLDPDDIADLLPLLNSTRKKQVLGSLENYLQEKTSILLAFDPETAGGLMSLDYIQVYKKATFDEVSTKVESHIKRTGNMPTILVTEKGKLVGTLSVAELIMAKDNHITAHIKPSKTIKYNLDQEEILHIFHKNDKENLVVLDDDGSILGIIKAHDLLKVIEKEATEDLFSFAGVQKDENILDPTRKKIQHRYKWLILNLGTAFLAAGVVSLFEGTISKYVLLAAYMPIISGMGGNAATQTLAVVIRGIALKQVDLANSWKIVLKEIGAGIVNGLINGLIIGIIAVLWNHDAKLGLVAALAMILNLFVAGFFGTLIPIILKKFNIDPAVAATVFVTTATDVFGFFAFLGLASIML